MEVELTGLVEFGSGGLNGATLTVFDRGVHAGAVLRRPGRLHLDLAQRRRRRLPAASSPTPPQKVLPDGRRGATGDDYVEENQAALDEILGFLKTFLLVFAGGLAGGRHLPDHQHLLDPGRPAQPRARAAPRAGRLAPPGQPVGAHRGARGRAASARRSGSACGYLLALGLRWLFGQFGLDLSRRRVPGRPGRTVVWSYAVGLVVTAIAADPAGPPGLPDRADGRAARRRRAARGDAAAPAVRRAWRMVVVGAVLMALGLTRRSTARRRWSAIGGGILLVLIGVALMSPVIGAPVLHLLRRGLPPAVRHGRARWPRRTRCATRAVRRPRPAR